MHSDFELIQKHFKDRNDITIVPISDVHLGASEHMETEWINFVNQVKSIPNCYIISIFEVFLYKFKIGVQSFSPYYLNFPQDGQRVAFFFLRVFVTFLYLIFCFAIYNFSAINDRIIITGRRYGVLAISS